MAIVQRVSLEGGDAVVRQLEDIGKRGQQAFQQVSQAASKADFDRLQNSLREISENGKRAGESLLSIGNKLTLLFGIEIAQGISGVVKSVAELGKASAEAVDDVADLATQAGTTAENMQSVLSVFRSTGDGIENVAERMRRFTVTVQKTWEDIKASVKDAARSAESDQLGIEEATVNLEQANINLAKSYKAVTAAIGDPLKMEQALLDVRKSQLAVSRSQIAAQEARQKAADNERNSVESLRTAVISLAKGTGDLSNVNVTAENVFKGIVAAVGPSVEALKGLSTNFGELAATKAPAAQEVLYLLADVFKNLKDETLKTAIAVQAFGRGVDIDFVKALSRGSEAFRARAKEIEALGLKIDETDEKTADAFKDAYRNLVDLLTLTKDKLGTILTPLYTTLAEGLSGLLKRSIGPLKEYFEGIKAAMTPVVEALSNILKGVSFADFKKEAKDAFTPEQYINIEMWQQRFLVLKEGVQVVIEVFKMMREVVKGILDEIAAMINAVFKTNISGDALGVGILVARFSGLVTILNLVVKGVMALRAAMISLTLVSLANPWVALATVVALIAVAVYTHWDKIEAKGKAVVAAVYNKWAEFKTNAQALWDGLGKAWDYYIEQTKAKLSEWGKWFQGLGATIAGYWKSFWETIEQLVTDGVNFIKEKWQAVADGFNNIVQTMRGYWQSFVDWVNRTASSIDAKLQAIKQALGAAKQASAEGGEGASSQAMAGGGLVRGPGTSTSDSVLARLSRGEFVVRAAAVRSVGTSFLHAINRAPGYALGGLVDAVRDGLASIAVPMAKGGPAPTTSGLRPFTLVMPGGSYGGLFAQETAVTSLRRAAVGAQIAATGRRPSWVR